MIEPRNRFVDCRRALACQVGRPSEQQHRYAEHTRGRDLAVSGRAAAVLGDADIDGVLAQQCTVRLFAERAACLNVVCMRNREPRFDGIHAANEVPVLGGLGEVSDFLAAKCEKYLPRLNPQRANRVFCALHLGPSIAGDLTPGRSAQGEQRSIGMRRCADRMSGDRCRVRMGRIDQCVDLVFAQIAREAVDPAETAPTHRYRLSQRRRGAASERQGRGNVVARREMQGELPGLRRAPENQDMSTHATH